MGTGQLVDQENKVESHVSPHLDSISPVTNSEHQSGKTVERTMLTSWADQATFLQLHRLLWNRSLVFSPSITRSTGSSTTEKILELMVTTVTGDLSRLLLLMLITATLAKFRSKEETGKAMAAQLEDFS